MKLALLTATLALTLGAAWPPPALTQAPGEPESETVLWVVYDGASSVRIEVPREFARKAVKVALCESGFNPAAVGAAGELGILQVHPVHAAAMMAAGLDFQSERDRILWAVELWQEQGGSPWACGHHAAGVN